MDVINLREKISVAVSFAIQVHPWKLSTLLLEYISNIHLHSGVTGRLKILFRPTTIKVKCSIPYST